MTFSDIYVCIINIKHTVINTHKTTMEHTEVLSTTDVNVFERESSQLLCVFDMKWWECLLIIWNVHSINLSSVSV